MKRFKFPPEILERASAAEEMVWEETGDEAAAELAYDVVLDREAARINALNKGAKDG